MMIIGLALLCMVQLNAQTTTEVVEVEPTPDSLLILPDDPVLIAIDSMEKARFFEAFPFVADTAKLNIYGFSSDSIPTYSSEVYKERLAKLDANSPFDLVYNERVEAFIKLYTVRKRGVSSRVLGTSHVYFPMFEEVLDQYDLPLEFKYLAVVESALNPKARSRAGATGLWQFMYPTGKVYGLKVSSYEDQRSDPYRSTVAACEYFTDLYEMFHDWDLVLAAYNCGQGRVARAIRRAGGQKDYWKLYPYLPRETRGYVPAFIAATYMMNYPAEHNLYPVSPKMTYFDFDSVHVQQHLTFDQLSEALHVPKEDLEFLNPSYKRGVIPFTGSPATLVLPKEKAGLFVLNEATIYERNKMVQEAAVAAAPVVQERRKSHIVRSGEYLGVIANKYGCSVNNIKDWNGLRSSRIQPGQRLIVYVSDAPSKPAKKLDVETEGNYKYYRIQRGDTLWDIAKAQGISISRLRALNKNLNAKSLKPGTKIVVGTS